MNRRTFLKTLALAGAFAGTSLRPRHAQAQATFDVPILLNVMLSGGPDFRHLVVPPYGDDTASYNGVYWNHRWRSHDLNNNSETWQTRWNEDYLHITDGGRTFGIWSGAAWLKAQYDAGNVAIISNVIGARDRNHVHAERIWDAGDRGTGLNALTRDGWGGRLAHALDGNVVSMTGNVRPFCFGPHPTDPDLHDNARVINARDTRNIGLYRDDDLIENPNSTNMRSRMGRGLESYYAALGETISDESVYAPLIEHESRIRAFGDAVDARLELYPLPAEIEGLYDGDNRLNNRGFGRQIRNVYDSMVCQDLLEFRVGSLELGGFDTHRDQRRTIEDRFSDLFGEMGGLAMLYQALDATLPGAREQLITVIGGEFGRQLVANGDQGTDHGRGNAVILIGDSVQGGIYGDLFPESEIERYLREASADIEGKTAIEPLFATIADAMMAGAGAAVFPDADTMEVEEGVDLSTLFEA